MVKGKKKIEGSSVPTNLRWVLVTRQMTLIFFLIKSELGNREQLSVLIFFLIQKNQFYLIFLSTQNLIAIWVPFCQPE